MAKILFITFHDFYCVGIRIIASYLEEHGHDCMLLLHESEKKEIDLYPLEHPIGYQTMINGTFYGSEIDFNPISEDEQQAILDQIEKFSPDSVGISTRSYLDDFCIAFAAKIKKRLPDVLIMAGGFGPTLSYEKYLETVDVVVRGEGEEASLEIADALDAGTSWKDIGNLAYMENGSAVCNPMKAPELQLSKYPHPMFGTPKILHMSGTKFKVETFEASEFSSYTTRYNLLWGRGCVGTCSYCSGGYWRTFYKENGKTMPVRRLRDIDDVMEEFLKAKNAGFKLMGLIDEFLIAPEHLLHDFFTKYKEKIGLPFSAYVHPHIVKNHPDIFNLMVEAGLHHSTVGIQSGSKNFSKNVYNRKYSAETIMALANALSSAGVSLKYHFIGANPLETDEDFEESLQLIKKLPFDVFKDTIWYFYLAVFPKSPMLDNFGKEVFQTRDVDKWLRQGVLVYLRLLLNDEQFFRIKSLSYDELRMETYKILLNLILKGQVLGEETLKGNSLNNPPKSFLDYAINYLNGKKIYIWGTGGVYQKRKHLLKNVEIICAFDNSIKKDEKLLLDGIPVLNPCHLQEMEPLPIFIMSSYKKEIFEQAKKLNPACPIF
ncbi:B12-binding domain-containing radical SAM protein [Maridesulfovibrio sp.]|uniref:B12-binding domain-containing radical SAM protein n=1 Tax=Maridesulfovibrio sp. TaxID=2795000 RepID=UPI002A1886D1|nr:radical SAM protein [Maridesulfovibrio sp.]